MNLLRRFRSIPVSYRVPVIVALLMVVISAAISERVLNRLSRTQESFLNGLADTYLDGLSSAVVPAVLREDVWEVFDALDRSSASYKSLAPIETVVTGTDGRVLAASDPKRIATYSELSADYLNRYGPEVVTIDEVQTDRVCPPRARLPGATNRDDPRHLRRVAPLCRAARDPGYAAHNQRCPCLLVCIGRFLAG